MEIRTGARVVLPAEPALDWEGEWIAERPYVSGDVVYRDGSSYRAVSASQGVDPLLGSGEWEFVAQKGSPGEPGTPGPPGPPGAGQSVEIEFPIPETEWIGSHGLGGYPAITTLDTNGQIIRGDEFYVDEQTVRIRWWSNGEPMAVAGKMILN